MELESESNTYSTMYTHEMFSLRNQNTISVADNSCQPSNICVPLDGSVSSDLNLLERLSPCHGKTHVHGLSHQI